MTRFADPPLARLRPDFGSETSKKASQNEPSEARFDIYGLGGGVTGATE